MTHDAFNLPDFDPNDPEAVDRMLDDRWFHALIEELGLAFRALPPEDQIEDLAVQLMDLTAKRDELTALLVDKPADDPRHRLLKGLNDTIAVFRNRIDEVRDQQPSG